MSDALWEGVREGCGSCEYGHRQEHPQWTDNTGKVHAPVTFLCRRYPPTMLMHIERSPLRGDENYSVEQVQPAMSETDWCGEWRRKGVPK